MIDPLYLSAILLMAAVTYLTRVGGYVLFRDRVMSARMQTVLESAPGCVLIAVIAPHFVSKNPADLIALAITVVAAMRLPMLPTVIIAIASAGLLRYLFG